MVILQCSWLKEMSIKAISGKINPTLKIVFLYAFLCECFRQISEIKISLCYLDMNYN